MLIMVQHYSSVVVPFVNDLTNTTTVPPIDITITTNYIGNDPCLSISSCKNRTETNTITLASTRSMGVSSPNVLTSI